MGKRPSYADLAARAERAVAGVKDPELRKVAYAKVLDDMLSSDTMTAPVDPRPPKSKEARVKTPLASNRRGPAGYIRELVDEGFFKRQKSIADVKKQLEERGHHIPITSLSGPLQKLCQTKVLRRQKRKSGKKGIYSYSEW